MTRKSILMITVLGMSLWSHSAMPAPLLPPLPGIDGLASTLGLALGIHPAGRNTGRSAAGVAPLGKLSPQALTSISGLTAGVPGIDGLNASSEAFHNALRGLDPALLRAALDSTDSALLQQVTRDLTQPLPGLRAPGLQTTLPGIDGLPVRLPTKALPAP